MGIEVPPARQARLEELIGQRPLAELPLPSLAREESALEKLAHRLRDWWDSLFPSLGTANDFEWLRSAIGFAVAAALVFALLMGIAGIVLWLTRRLPAALGSGSVQAPARDAPDVLLAEIGRASGDGDFGLAARLRWRLFQRRKRLRESVTPAEFAPAAPWLPEAYELMFGGKREADSFARLERALTGIEAGEPDAR